MVIQALKKALTSAYLPAIGLVLALVGCQSPDQTPEVARYYIQCAADSLEWLYNHPKENRYIQVALACEDGTRITGKLRLRGDTSRDFDKKSLKIKLDHPLPDGVEVLNLNAEYLDKSYLRQYLCSRIIRQAGVHCFTTRHAAVYINETFHGLYLQVSNMDADFLKQQGLDPHGALYKAAKDGACLSAGEALETLWEKKTGDNKHMVELAQLVEALHETPPSHLKPFLQAAFDYDRLVRLVALNIYLCNGSTWYHNYYLYRDTRASGKWTLMPWDLDKSLSYYDWKLPFETSGDYTGDNVLAEKIFRCEPVMEDVSRALKEIDAMVREMNPASMISSAMHALKPWVELDARDDVADASEWQNKCRETAQFFDHTLNNRLSQLALRPAQFDVVEQPYLDRAGKTLRWHASRWHADSAVQYTVTWVPESQRWNEALTCRWTTTDTTFTLPDTVSPGEYVWKVEARLGAWRLSGYPSVQRTLLVETQRIDAGRGKTLRLAAGASPYAVDTGTRLAAGSTCHVEAGATILLMPGTRLIVEGEWLCQGTADKPVTIMAAAGWNGAEAIDFSNGRANVLQHVNFYNVRVNYHSSDLHMEHCSITMTSSNLDLEPGRASMLWGEKGECTVRHCAFIGNQTGEGMNLHEGTAVVEHNTFVACPDAIELIDMHDCRIRGNAVRFSKDDAIDLNNCRQVSITGNAITRCTDKGISVGADHRGKSQSIAIHGNYIALCRTAIEVKDSSEATLSCNLFDQNSTAVAARRRDPDYALGGNITTRSNAFSLCDSCARYYSDSLSVIRHEQDDAEALGEKYSLGIPLLSYTPDTGCFPAPAGLLKLEMSGSERLMLRNDSPFMADISGYELACASQPEQRVVFGAGLVIRPYATLSMTHKKTEVGASLRAPAGWFADPKPTNYMLYHPLSGEVIRLTPLK